ncbi:hypothetical protein JTB14_005192 [Gonioctena quinquepunctata]|nr:hypothetical protein JTB14_005192 [Gonioctena quinquepunctata]
MISNSVFSVGLTCNMLWLMVLCGVFVVIDAQYEVPDALVETLSPRGFRVSIPDEEGIKLFAFHGKINQEMEGREAGTFSRDILKPKNGRWTFTDTTTKLKAGDVIYYWTYVEYSADGQNKLGYPKDDQMFTVTELVQQTNTSTTPIPVATTAQPVQTTVHTGDSSEPCEQSVTTFNNGRRVCKGKIIFNDAFTTEVRKKFWTVQQKFAGAPDYAFVTYVNRPETLFIRNRVLRIKPELSDDVFGPDFVNMPYNFGENCTGIAGTQECQYRPDAGFILPPVLSSQLTTFKKFSFKYGKIEIRAKLPKGDWIYPELYLNSLNEEYGPGYDSGQIRVAFAPGNSEEDKVLQGGIVLGSSVPARKYGIKTIERTNRWGTEFHKFAITWKPVVTQIFISSWKYTGAIISEGCSFTV